MVSLPDHLDLAFHESEPYPREVPLREAYAGLRLPEGTAGRPFCYLLMVQTFDGETVIGGKAFTIGSDVDHHLFRQLRVHADAVLYGAGTLEHDDVIVTTHPYLRERRIARGASPNPLAVVASTACEFPAAVFEKQFFTRRDFSKLVLTTRRATKSRIKKVEAAGVPVEVVDGTGGHVDVAAVMRYLGEVKGARRVLCEGGPHFNVSLAAADLIDELFITVALHLGAETDSPRLFAEPIGDRRLQVISELRYRTPSGIHEYYFRLRFAPR
ncbi:MAG TPA: dihydrofolate reductase family protein [bacterium]|nr:dihydrofolate reductase family protein [bacterium]